MGCVHSRHDINDQHANIFQVVNVDDLGHRFNAAMLEVTDAHLVLHQRGRTPIRWPIRCLRRYGFDAELFSFESGRRCPTGPGVYSFKCRRAEALFNMLQLQIQNITGDVAVPREFNDGREGAHEEFLNRPLPASLDPEGYLEPVQRSQSRAMNVVVPAVLNNGGITSVDGATGGVTGVTGVTSGAGNSVSFGSRNSTVFMSMGRSPASPPTPLSPPPVPYENNLELTQAEESPASIVQEVREPPPPPSPTEPTRGTVLVNHIDKVVAYENHVGRPTSCGNSFVERVLIPGNSLHIKRPRSYGNYNPNKPPFDVTDQLYVNIVPEVRDLDHVYVNLGKEKEKDVPAVPPRPSLAAGSGGSGSSHSGTTTTTDTEHHHSQLNYCVLDLDHGSDSSQTAPLSPLGSVTSGPESPHRIGQAYATIDISKTEALLETAKPASAWEDGSRRTRHNSTFISPGSLVRHNSSLSD